MFGNDDNRGLITGTNVLCFFLGAAVGAAVAVLYAPASGSETREQIATKAGEWKDKAAEMKDQAMDKASHWKEAAASKINEMTGRASDTMQAAKNGVDKVGSTAHDEMANVGETARG
jgi:gas vesicle protein